MRLLSKVLVLILASYMFSVNAAAQEQEPPKPGMVRLNFQLSSFANTAG
ncbi:MAG: hypothetical protein GY863_17200, partial [bacterium]|nr:hypothetical protein [bacterium]